jgi:hypothetical protein
MHDICFVLFADGENNHPIGRGRGYRYGLHQVLFKSGEK